MIIEKIPNGCVISKDAIEMNMTKEEIERQQPYFYWLQQIPGIGDKTMRALFTHVNKPEEIYYAGEEELQGWKGAGVITEAQLRSIKYRRTIGNIYSEYDKLRQSGISIYPFYHPGYPMRLRNIPDMPGALYVKGKLPDDNKKSLAIIGARNCSDYGIRMAEEFAGFLGGKGIQIISGMAKGVDGVSQSAALDAGGESFGVLGCGVDICYPASNRILYNQLVEKGGVISAYSPGTMPQRQFFPPRNRIISGLSDALLVIEAREKSGTLITVDMALEQGRDVYALPGRVGDAISEGCNRLIAAGAGMALSPEMLLAELDRTPTNAISAGSCPGRNTQIDTSLCHCGNNSHINIEETHIEETHIEETLDINERKIYRLLDVYPKSLDVIWEELNHFENGGMTILEVMHCLVGLCMKDVAERVQGSNVYKIKNKYF